MNSFHRNYADQIFKNFGLYANYPAIKEARIGDVGVLDGNLYTRKDTLNALTGLNINLMVGNRITMSDHLNFSTKGQTEISFFTKGNNNLGRAGMEVGFKAANSFFFNLAGIRVQEIENQLLLNKKILDLFYKGIWEKDWVLVTAVLISESTLIFGTSTAGGKITLEAKTSVSNIDLTKADLKWNISNMSSLEMNIIDYNGLTPLVELSKIKRKALFRRSMGMIPEQEVTDVQLLDMVRSGKKSLDDTFEFSVL